MGRDDLADDDEQRGPDKRPEQRSGAADNRPDHALAGHLIEHVRGRCISSEECEERARHSGEKSRHDESHQAQQIDVQADQRSAQIIIPYRQEGPAQRTMDDKMHQPQAQRDD